MYNLTVANDHTYFVGVGGVLGHNCDIDEIVQKLVRKIPKKYCENFQCVEFSKDLMKKLDAKGIPYEKAELKSSYSYIWSDKLGDNISRNGYHIGVKIGDKVYDNNNPFGLHYNDWYADFIMR